MDTDKKPIFAKYFIPMIHVIKELGGSGTRKEIISTIIDKLGISEQEQDETLKNGALKIENQIHWAEIYLVKGGLIDSSNRGILTLTDKGNSKEFSESELIDIYKRIKTGFTQMAMDAKKVKIDSPVFIETSEELVEISDFKKELLIILKQLPPSGFERICQRLLREAGFEQVVVTGKTGDGGIDGHGLLEINPLMTFKVIFQCKRYEGSVSSGQIRDFRGAMMGRADKGIFITTGRFTNDAVKEALRDGVPPIELVDGDKLVGLFEKTQLGLKQKTIFEIDNSFFNEFNEK